MKFEDYINLDKDLYFEIESCEKVINNAGTSREELVDVLSKRALALNKRNELKKLMTLQHLLQIDK